MLAPILVPKLPPRSKGGRKPKLHSCGKYGRLSARQIATIAGITDKAVHIRIAAGWKGEQLCQPVGDRPNHKKSTICQPTMLMAVKIARRFRDRVPTVKELQAMHPMSLNAAIRWRRALRIEAEAA